MSLAVQELKKSFGGVHAVNGASFTAKAGRITALIGPNGAGKTTVFNLITGLVRPDEGSITYKGEPLTALEAHQIFHLGIARTFQLLRIFPKLTALENLMLAHPGNAEGVFDRIIRPRLVKAEEEAKRKRCREYLDLVGLGAKSEEKAGDLSYGQQKLLDIARALATEAELILLDEPVAGVNPKVREQIKKLLLKLKQEGRSILVVEHDMSFIMGISDTVVVLDHGDEIAIGPPATVRKNKKVIEAYLGS